MEIVVKIPDDMIKSLEQGSFGAKYNIYDLVWRLMNGTLLPKGHGRIADIDKVLEEMKITRTYDIPFVLGRVKPIIEADTESEDKE